MIAEIYYQIVDWSLDSITLILFAFLFWRFLKSSQKNFILNLFLILNISCCILPLMNLITLILGKNSPASTPLAALSLSMWHFSMFWSAAIAIFVYVAITHERPFNPNKFMVGSLTLCLILTLALYTLVMAHAFGLQIQFYAPGMYAFKFTGTTTSDKVAYLLILDLWGRSLPILISLYCYLRVVLTLKMRQTKSNPLRVLWYPIIQIICIFPGVFLDIIATTDAFQANSACSFIINVFHHLWAPLYLFTYLIFHIRTADENNSESQSSLIDSLSIGD